MRKLTALMVLVGVLLVGVQEAAADQLEINGIVVEPDGDLTHLGYPDGSVWSIYTPTTLDHLGNLYECLGRSGTPETMYEDYSCTG